MEKKRALGEAKRKTGFEERRGTARGKESLGSEGGRGDGKATFRKGKQARRRKKARLVGCKVIFLPLKELARNWGVLLQFSRALERLERLGPTTQRSGRE